MYSYRQTLWAKNKNKNKKLEKHEILVLNGILARYPS